MKGILCFVFCLYVSEVTSQWNNKTAAIVLTYDDALDEHLTNAIPALDSVNLKGTFYIADYLNHLEAKTPEWKKAAENGHELGNHTLKHPCAGGRPGREFVKADNDLNNLTYASLKEDIVSLNALLYKIDGKKKRSFAYPCGDQLVGNVRYMDSLRGYFNAARGVMPAMPTKHEEVNLYDVACYSMAGQSGEEMIDLVDDAFAKKGLLIFLFHGVGGGHALNVTYEAHSKLLRYLKSKEHDLWIAPMVDVADYLSGK